MSNSDPSITFGPSFQPTYSSTDPRTIVEDGVNRVPRFSVTVTLTYEQKIIVAAACSFIFAFTVCGFIFSFIFFYKHKDAREKFVESSSNRVSFDVRRIPAIAPDI